MHDKADALDKILTEHPEMDFVQLQINYADWNSITVESRKCLDTAKKHGKPVIIMEPIRGGNLSTPPQEVVDLMKKANPDISPSAWALNFALSLEGVEIVLSGMSNMEQLSDNLDTMKRFSPMNDEECAVIEKAQAILESIPSIPCTNCLYCVKDCPSGINIPSVIKSLNTLRVFKNMAGAKRDYSIAQLFGEKASTCIACGNCETACPQSISIIEEMKNAVSEFE